MNLMSPQVWGFAAIMTGVVLTPRRGDLALGLFLTGLFLIFCVG